MPRFARRSILGVAIYRRLWWSSWHQEIRDQACFWGIINGSKMCSMNLRVFLLWVYGRDVGDVGAVAQCWILDAFLQTGTPPPSRCYGQRGYKKRFRDLNANVWISVEENSFFVLNDVCAISRPFELLLAMENGKNWAHDMIFEMPMRSCSRLVSIAWHVRELFSVQTSAVWRILRQSSSRFVSLLRL